MCGIAGYLSTHPCSIDTWGPRLEQASKRMAARGPDAHGIVRETHFGLAHRRLSILDPANGRQPMKDPETGMLLAFNGEIYNFRDLRHALESAGHVFQTRSDTEVLLHAYREWGEACLDRLIGMFAFAIYDPRDTSLLLARDRIGVKPLYWKQSGSVLGFASTVPALLALFPGRPDLNPDAVSHYLSTIRVNLGAQTLLQGISLLEPGHILRSTRSAPPRIRRYWKPTCLSPSDKPQRSMDTAADELKNRMHEAVRLRLVSDVPLGGFLSGGLDSTVIAAEASRLTAGGYHAYGVGFPQPGYHEFPFIQEAAAAYGMKCRCIELNAEAYTPAWEYLVHQNGLPLTTPNEVPIFLLSRALRQDYTVALSGEGADEVFGGYTIAYFAGHDFDRAARSPKSDTELNETDRALVRGYGQSHLPGLAEQHFLLNSWLSPEEKRLWLHPDVIQYLRNDRTVRMYYEALYSEYPHASTLDRIMLAHLRVNLEGLLLRVDSSSMAASVEVRVPFTDHRLVDFAFSLPDSFRLDWRTPDARGAGETLNVREIVQQDLIESKRVLRHAYRDCVPSSILTRPKMSFPAPVFEWMNNGLGSALREIVASSNLRNTLLNPATVDAWLSRKQAPAHPMKLWPIVNLCLWDACR